MLKTDDRLNVSWSEQMTFVWYRVAKTGTRTLNQILSDNCPDYRYVARSGPKLMQPTDVKRFNDLTTSRCFTFTIVRNPWDRAVSAWLNKIRVDPRAPSYTSESAYRHSRFCKALDPSLSPATVFAKDFDWFIQRLPESKLFRNDAHFMPQTQILSDLDIEYEGRFEDYEQSIRVIFDRIGLSAPTNLPHKNRSKSPAKEYCNYFTEESKATVAKLYAEDIDRYEYSYG